jgi:hypothetical protein
MLTVQAETTQKPPSTMFLKAKKSVRTFEVNPEPSVTQHRASSQYDQSLPKLLEQESAAWTQDHPSRPKPVNETASSNWWTFGWHRNGSPSGTVSGVSHSGKNRETQSIASSSDDDIVPDQPTLEPSYQNSMLRGTGSGLEDIPAPQHPEIGVDQQFQTELEIVMELSKKDAQRPATSAHALDDWRQEEEEQLRQAMELSEMESSQLTIRPPNQRLSGRDHLSRRRVQDFEPDVLPNEEEETLRRVLELSKQDR